MDWRKVERTSVRERIDNVFHIMEKEYGVTRLLDPEGRLIKYSFDLANIKYFPSWKRYVSLLRSATGKKNKKSILKYHR